jgi:hypothetical protein
MVVAVLIALLSVQTLTPTFRFRFFRFEDFGLKKNVRNILSSMTNAKKKRLRKLCEIFLLVCQMPKKKLNIRVKLRCSVFKH